MKVSEAIELVKAQGSIIVACGKHEYLLERDVVEVLCAAGHGNDDDEGCLVYGFYVKPHPRVKANFKHFKLKNAKYLRPGN